MSFWSGGVLPDTREEEPRLMGFLGATPGRGILQKMKGVSTGKRWDGSHVVGET